MAKKRKEDPVDNTITLDEISPSDLGIILYYNELYKHRLDWTKHQIPISFKDYTGLYMEGFIDTVKAINNPEEEVLVQYAHMPTSYVDVVSVSIKNIFPTKRKVFAIDTSSYNSFEGELLAQPFDISYGYTITPTPTPITLKNIRILYNGYPNLEFSANEFYSFFNNCVSLHNSIIGLQELYLKDEFKIVPTITKRDSISGEFRQFYKLSRYSTTKKTKMTTTQSTTTGTVCTSIPALDKSYDACQSCELGHKRIARNGKVVHGQGSLNPDIFIIGEAPGVQEEQNGEPFYPKAPAGDVLDKVLTASGIKNVWKTNSVICRPEPDAGDTTQNGAPKIAHIQACNSRLKNELYLVNPKIVVLLGKYAYRAYFGIEPTGGVMGNIGWVNTPTSHFPVYFLNHPSHVVRQLANITDIKEKIRIKKEYLSHWTEIKKASDDIVRKIP